MTNYIDILIHACYNVDKIKERDVTMNELTRYETGLSIMQNEIAKMNTYELYTNTLTPMTKKNYISTIKGFFGVDDLSDITIEMLKSVTPEIANMWATKQVSEGAAKSTVNNKLSGLQNFYKFLCRRSIGIMEYNPFSPEEGCIRFKNTTKTYSDKRALAPHEVTKLLRSVDIENAKGANKIIAYRDLVVLQVLITAGLRRAELANIKIGDIKINQGEYTIEVLGKGNKTRYMVLAKPVKHTIDVYLKLRDVTYQDKDLPLIISHSSNADPTKHVDTMTIYRIVKKYADRAGLNADSIAPHNLRHTFATTAYGELGVNKDTLQELLGHTSQNTTQRYIKSTQMIKNSPSDKLAEMFEM